MKENKLNQSPSIDEDGLFLNRNHKSTLSSFIHMEPDETHEWETRGVRPFAIARIELMWLLKYWMKKILVVYQAYLAEDRSDEDHPDYDNHEIYSTSLAIKRIKAIEQTGILDDQEIERVIMEVNREVGVYLSMGCWCSYLYNGESSEWFDKIKQIIKGDNFVHQQ